MSDIVLSSGTALSSRERYRATSASTLGHGGVLSARELRWLSETGEVDLAASASSPAEWLSEALSAIRGLVDRGRGWDSHDARAIDQDAARIAATALRSLAWPTVPAPRVVGTSTGGVLLEWYRPTCELQIEIDPIEGVSVLFADATAGTTWEAPFGDEPEGIDKLMYRLTLAS